MHYAILCYHDEAAVNALTRNEDDALMAELAVVRDELIGSEGGLPLPSAHTTVRTGPYTAVRKIHYLAETCSRRLRRPHCANSRLGIAACICEAPAFHQALRPVAVALRARSAHRPNATSFRYRVLG